MNGYMQEELDRAAMQALTPNTRRIVRAEAERNPCSFARLYGLAGCDARAGALQAAVTDPDLGAPASYPEEVP